jgi:hypothetical protein
MKNLLYVFNWHAEIKIKPRAGFRPKRLIQWIQNGKMILGAGESF